MTREKRERRASIMVKGEKALAPLRTNSARARSDCLTGLKACSLHSKRFLVTRSKERPRKDEERDFQFWPGEKWNESQKNVPFFARSSGSLTLVPRSLLRNRTETLATQANQMYCSPPSRSARRRFAPLQKSRSLNFI